MKMVKNFYDEKYLLENPDLCHNSEIMESAILNNPKLIRLVKGDCILSDELIKLTLKKYKITKNDLEQNPELCKNYKIMQYCPEFRLYSAFLADKEKIDAIVSCLKDGRDINLDNLPFFNSRFGSEVDIFKLSELSKFLNINFDENDLKQQSKFFTDLDKIIDGIVNIRYLKAKFSFDYPDAVVLNDAMVKTFSLASRTKDLDILLKFINDLYIYCGKKVTRSSLKKQIVQFYKFYLEKGSIGLFLTNEFCNEILNQHRNVFFSAEKDIILRNLEVLIELSDKKKKSVLTGRKMKKVTELLKFKEFKKLGITSEYYFELLDNVKSQILKSNIIKKSNILIDDLFINNLTFVFNYYGYLDENQVCSVLNIETNEIVKYIVKKFESIKVKLLDNIDLSAEESEISLVEKLKLGRLSHYCYLIGDRNRIYENIAKIFLRVDNDILDEILENKENLLELASLIPFVDLISELDINTFINILSNYERVKWRMFLSGSFEQGNVCENNILMKIDEIINLSNACGSLDEITVFALGKDFVSLMREDRINSYLDFYIKMLNKQFCEIPAVSVSTEEFNFDSGVYSDPERLLIGLKTKASSCIDLFEAGVVTYNEVLCKSSGDVILVHDKNNNLVSRILLFRRGNVVQMVTQVVDRFSMEVYKKIADQIMESAIMNGDNIDYVFVNSSAYNISDLSGDKEKYMVVSDNRFVDNFPHADFSDSAILLSSRVVNESTKISELKLDFDVSPVSKYLKKRREILYNPTENDITRLRALSIVMEEDKIKKDTKSREFKSFCIADYKIVICGEDWYIALRNDGFLEEVILPLKDERSYVEFYEAKNEILTMNNTHTKVIGKV